MDIGNKIKEIRKKNGLSQKELGKSLGVSQAMIAQYENGIRKPKYETLQKIATALNVDISDLLSPSDIIEQSKEILTGFDPDEAFCTYLKSLGYDVEERQKGNKRKIQITGVDADLYITNKEMKSLKQATEKAIKEQLNNYLHDGKHTKK